MNKIVEFLNGKKTFLVALIAAGIAGLQAAGIIGSVPDYVWQVLGALGLAAVRDGINKVGK